MNREILFRGKRADNSEWVYGNLVILDNQYYINEQETRAVLVKETNIGELEARIMEESYGFEKVIPEIIGQYTGLTDKNGKKIFEGDKVMNDYSWTKPTEIGVITWNENNSSFQIRGHIPSSSMKHLNRMKVIGNIHDGGNE